MEPFAAIYISGSFLHPRLHPGLHQTKHESSLTLKLSLCDFSDQRADEPNCVHLFADLQTFLAVTRSRFRVLSVRRVYEKCERASQAAELQTDTGKEVGLQSWLTVSDIRLLSQDVRAKRNCSRSREVCGQRSFRQAQWRTPSHRNTERVRPTFKSCAGRSFGEYKGSR